MKDMSKWSALLLGALISGVLTLTGCAPGPNAEDAAASQRQDAEALPDVLDDSGLEERPYEEFTLPRVPDEGLCGGRGQSVCEWVHADAIVYGEITDIRLTDDPMVYSVPGADPQFVADCEGPRVLAMEVDLRIEEVLYGGMNSSNITVHVGSARFERWRPSPIAVDDDGAIIWGAEDDADPLIVGRRVGFRIFFLQGPQLWTSVAEPMFRVDAESTLEFQEHACQPHIIDQFEALTMAEFGELIGECDGSEGQVANQWLKDLAERLPNQSYAATWRDPVNPNPTPPDCQSNAECQAIASDHVCFEGACIDFACSTDEECQVVGADACVSGECQGG